MQIEEGVSGLDLVLSDSKAHVPSTLLQFLMLYCLM